VGNIRNWLAALGRDPLRETLADALQIQVDPGSVRDYALPDYVRYKHVQMPWLHKWLKKNPVYPLIKGRAPLVLPGDWDQVSVPFTTTPVYAFLADLQACAFDYKNTHFYAALLSDLQAGKLRSYKSLLLNSEQAIDQLFEGYVRVFKSMAAEGYKADKAVDPICVMVARDGRLIKEEKGRHRLAIAQLVGVERVPVLVRHIHPDWLRAVEGAGARPVAATVMRALQQLSV
jgi:hypothetical protein